MFEYTDIITNKCDLCGATLFKIIYIFDDWKLVECKQCKHRWGEPRPDYKHIKPLYNQHFFKSRNSRIIGYSNYEKENSLRLNTFKSYLRRIEEYIEPGLCLDIGCAYGYFLQVAENSGWTAEGVDISHHACQYARTVSAKVACADFLEYDVSEKYHLITAWDVIEHAFLPSVFFSKVNTSLKKNGLFALSLPDYGSIMSRIYKKHWFEYKWPEHLYYFNRKTVKEYLNRAGFDVFLIEYARKYKLIGDALSRWLGFYEAPPWLNKLFNKKTIYYSSLSEMFILAKKSKDIQES